MMLSNGFNLLSKGNKLKHCNAELILSLLQEQKKASICGTLNNFKALISITIDSNLKKHLQNFKRVGLIPNNMFIGDA